MPSDMSPSNQAGPPTFKRNLTRVLLVQLGTLILLWILQSLYHV